MKHEINKRLNDMLCDHNISAVAKEIGMSRSVLHDWVHGNRLPSLKNIAHLKKLAIYLEVTLEELLTFSEKKETVSSTTFIDNGARYLIKIERLD